MLSSRPQRREDSLGGGNAARGRESSAGGPLRLPDYFPHVGGGLLGTSPKIAHPTRSVDFYAPPFLVLLSPGASSYTPPLPQHIDDETLDTDHSSEQMDQKEELITASIHAAAVTARMVRHPPPIKSKVEKVIDPV